VQRCHLDAHHDRRGRLEELAKRYGWDVAGNFDPRLFQLSTRLLPPIVTALLAPRTLTSLVKEPAKVFSAQQATCA
jgi:glycerol-3-phosphate O-acyltransferase